MFQLDHFKFKLIIFLLKVENISVYIIIICLGHVIVIFYKSSLNYCTSQQLFYATSVNVILYFTFNVSFNQMLYFFHARAILDVKVYGFVFHQLTI
jgi:hypothetical protein